MIKILIVEDEKPIRETLQEIIQNNCPDISIVGTAENIESACRQIIQTTPDLVLLDVNLPDGTCFELIQQLEHIHFKIIFITAFEEYAIQAIKLSALDYLVKPVDPIELSNAINKARDLIEKDNDKLKLSALLSNINQISDKNKKIILKTADSIFLIDIQDIIRCESDGSYTKFFINDGRKIMISKVLKDYEELLQNCGFARVHKSHIINLNYIERFDKHDGGSIILKDKSNIPVSTRKREQLIKVFEDLAN